MSGPSLKEVVLELIDAHPAITISPAGHATHALRFLADNGNPIALEPERVRFQNLWVRADSVNFGRLKDIDHVAYRAADFEESKPNHNLFGEPAFKSGDLIRFKVTTAWEAARIIFETAGDGGAK